MHDNRVLSLGNISDVRVQQALERLTAADRTPIRPGDLFYYGAANADGHVCELLSSCVRAGYGLRDAIDHNVSLRGITTTSGNGHGISLTSEALEALSEFATVLESQNGTFKELGFELFLICAIKRFGLQDRLDWDLLNVDQVKKLLRDQIETAESQMNERQEKEGDGTPHFEYFMLPRELAPSENLTANVREHLDLQSEASPFDGSPQHSDLFERLQRALHGRGPRHSLLIGEQGVGQFAVLTEFARRAASGTFQFLSDRQFVWADCRLTMSQEGAARLSAIMSQVGAQQGLVLCIEGLAALLRQEGAVNNVRLFLTQLSRLQCSVIGLLSPREYQELFSGEALTSEHLSEVFVPEPEPPVALAMLRRYAVGLEHEFGVSIEEDALRHSVALSNSFILNERLPAKALKVLHSVCRAIDYDRDVHSQERNHVTTEDVVKVTSELSGVPEETLRGVAADTNYEESLSHHVFGQPHAVAEVAAELGLIKAGLVDPGKPASVMLFIGQTGTGKTELAKALARFYSSSKRLKTFTLGNFGEPHSVSGLIGVPAGYVGHDLGGRLINDLIADPYGVFLLDEADKAHPDVMQPFLNLFDEGWIEDQRGVRAYADKSIFILTTNVAQRQIGDMCRAGNSMEEITSRTKETLSQIRHTKSNRPVFTPEFLARIKRTIVFRSLGEEAMELICQKLVRQMQADWADKRHKRLVVDESLVSWVAKAGHKRNEASQGKEGGRILRKLIADHIETPLQRHISRNATHYQCCREVHVEGRFAPEVSEPPEVNVTFSEQPQASVLQEVS